MTRQIEVADNFRAQERYGVGEDGKFEAGNNLLGDRGAPEDVAPFQNEDFLPAARKIRCVDEAVVPAADDDHVVFLGHQDCPRFARATRDAAFYKPARRVTTKRSELVLRSAQPAHYTSRLIPFALMEREERPCQLELRFTRRPWDCARA